jgi:hypothetical protein
MGIARRRLGLSFPDKSEAVVCLYIYLSGTVKHQYSCSHQWRTCIVETGFCYFPSDPTGTNCHMCLSDGEPTWSPCGECGRDGQLYLKFILPFLWYMVIPNKQPPSRSYAFQQLRWPCSYFSPIEWKWEWVPASSTEAAKKQGCQFRVLSFFF